MAASALPDNSAVLFGSVQQSLSAVAETALLAQLVDVSPPGYAIPVQWTAVAGANDVDVSQASMTVSPAIISRNISLAVTASVNAADVAVPPGVGLASVTLTGLQVQDPADASKMIDVRSDSDFPQSDQGMYLVMSIKGATGTFTPLATSPGLGSPGGFLPPPLAGIAFASGVAKLPAFVSAVVRFQVVRGNDPQSFKPQNIKIASTVSAQTIETPSDLQLTGPDNAVLWSFAGVMPAAAPPAAVDFSAALKRSLKASLPAAPTANFTLSASKTSSAYISGLSIAGAFLRTTSGTLYADLAGDPALLTTAPATKPRQKPPTQAFADTPLAAETPSSATADIRVKYNGVRILPAVNDQVPAFGTANGIVVESTPVVRVVPPNCLGGLPVAKVGLIGRAPVPCSLTVQLVDMSSGAPGGPVGKPGTANLTPSAALATVWVDMPASPPPSGPIAVSVQCSQGRFLWVSTDKPLTRIAVNDPNPGSRPVRIGSSTLVTMDTSDKTVKAAALPADAFASTPQAFTSELFASVTLGNLTLRYAR